MSGDVPELSLPRAGMAMIRLRRPDQANRIEPRDLAAMHEHFDSIEARGDVSILLLASSGRVFSAGFDLGALTANPRSSRRENGFEDFANRLARLSLVTIAALQGPVVGGATDLALACDIRLGTERTIFKMPAAQIGMPLYPSALHRFVAAFGVARAKRLVLTATTMAAEELQACGVLAEIVEDVDARAIDLATELAALPAAPLLAMKAVISAAVPGDGPTAADHARLDAAYDAAVIAQQVEALAARRRT